MTTIICDGEGGDAVCQFRATRVQADVSEAEFTVDLEAGTAALHADLEGCRLDLDSSSSVPAETTYEDRAPSIGPSTGLMSVSLFITRQRLTSTRRSAAMTGSICDLADVSGPPTRSQIFQMVDSYDTTEIKIEPTA